MRLVRRMLLFNSAIQAKPLNHKYSGYIIASGRTRQCEVSGLIMMGLIYETKNNYAKAYKNPFHKRYPLQMKSLDFLKGK